MTTTNQPEPGAVVRWRTRSSIGIGQIADIAPDGSVTVRAWLPTRSKEITTTLDRITLLPALHEATRQATNTAALLAGGLS